MCLSLMVMVVIKLNLHKQNTSEKLTDFIGNLIVNDDIS